MMEGDFLMERTKSLEKLFQTINFLKEDNVPCAIEEGLYLGSFEASCNKSGLKSLKITHILTVGSFMYPAHPDDFVYKTIGVLDKVDEPISQYFDECIQFIEGAKATGGGVLVHCFAGRSRSVTIILAFLMLKRGMNYSEAFEHVKILRPQASPNFGFISQLKKFERSLQGNKIEGTNEV